MTSQEIQPASLEARYAAFCTAHPLRRVTLKEHCWFYRQGGAAPRHAPTVLLLPGALGRAETGFEYAAALGAYLRVIAPSYPATAQTMRDLADGAAALLEACGVKQAHVVGGSFGGLVAQTLFDRHPHRVKRLVLSDTSAPVPARRLRMRAALLAIGALPERGVRAVLRLGVSRYVAVLPPDARRFWRHHFEEMLSRLTKSEVENRARAWAEFDGTAFRPAAAACPRTLILWAASDHAVSPDKLSARFPQAALHVVASPLGHAASIGDAPAYLVPLLRFLSEAEP